MHYIRPVQSVLCLLSLTMAPLAFATLQNDPPTGGTNITKRTCIGGEDDDFCSQNSDCDNDNCFPYNVVDITVNLFGFLENEPAIPTNDEVAVLKEQFTEVSRLLFDVTDGQMLLGTIILVVDNGAPNAAVQMESGVCSGFTPCNGACNQQSDCQDPDFPLCVSNDCCDHTFGDENVFAAETCEGTERPILNGSGGGSASAGGWGNGGKINATLDCLIRPKCFIHEIMHFIAGLLEEYKGNTMGCQFDHKEHRCFGGKDDGLPCNPNLDQCEDQGMNNPGLCRRIVCIDPGPPEDPLSVEGCIMRGSKLNVFTELCDPGNHDENFDTMQSHCHGNDSCWTTLAFEWSQVLQAPQGAPDPGPNALPVEPDFVIVDNVQGRFVTVIDRSGSMDEEAPRRIDVAIDVTRDFVDLLDDDTDFGLASFAFAGGNADPDDVDTTKDFPDEDGLRSLQDNTDREDAKVAIGALTGRAGGDTRIGAGLLKAKEMILEAGGQVTLNTAVVLATDGLTNRPEGSAQQDLDDALTELFDAGIPIYVTCIGEAASTDQCAHIADQTGGLFIASDATDDLPDAFIEFAAEVQGQEISASVLGTPISEGDLSAPVDALVEEGVEVARFVANWTRGDSNLDLKLFRPDDTQVSEALKQPLSQGEQYVIQDPQPGTWTMRVAAVSVLSPPESFSARAILDNAELNVEAGLVQTEVAWPDVFTISVHPSVRGSAVTGCDASLHVTMPLGTEDAVALSDDGAAPDRQAGDGLYQIDYANLEDGDGNYTFTLVLQCRSTEAAIATDPGNAEPTRVPVIPDFDRTFRFSGSASGVPDDLPPTAVICSDLTEAECEGVATDVALDGTCSFDPEGEELAYSWSSPTGEFNDAAAAMPVGSFPLGFNEVSLVVHDPANQASAPDIAFVGITDNVPPILMVELVPDLLWPPDHKLVAVHAHVTVMDLCDPAPSVVLVSITSDEDDNAPGGGDGNTVDDIQNEEIGLPDFDFDLRAERSASGAGRTYTVTYTATDASFNETTVSATAFVPHDQSGVTEELMIGLEQNAAGTVVLWDPVVGATAYNVIRGTVGLISETPQAIGLGPIACIEASSSDETTVGYEDTETPPAGEAFFYLVEYDDGAPSSYGTESADKPREPGPGACL